MNTEKANRTVYLIDIKLDNEKSMLIHGYTGAIDIVSNELADYLKNNPCISTHDFPFSNKTLNSLFNRGYLTTKTKEEEIAYVQKISEILSLRNNYLSTKSFTLVVTYDCNFSCPYCFEKDLIQKEHSVSNLTISKEMVDKFFNTIPLIEPNKSLCNRAISLFGGEPLLKENKEIISYIIKKGKENGFVFTATSNGYDLDSYKDLLDEKSLRGIQVTIDGSRDTHNTRRIHTINTFSFDKIISNIKFALNKGIAIKVRINVDEDNINELSILDTFFKTEGLYKFPHFSAYASYISGQMNFNPESYTTKNEGNKGQRDFLNLFNSNKWQITYEQELYGNFHHAIEKGTSLSLSPSHCNAHFGSFIFDPFGNIYSCLEQVGKKDEAIGTYVTGLEWNTKTKAKWFEQKINSLIPCYKCKYALLCGGGCYAKKLETKKQASGCDELALRLNSVARNIYFTLQ